MSDQPAVPELAEPEAIPAPQLPTTGLSELDRALDIMFAALAQRLDAVVDEVYAGLSYAYPGLYADPDAPTSTHVEWRVTETTGHVRWLTGSAAVHAHRLGLKVERRTVTTTEWVVEPNPNTRIHQPVPAHPMVHPAADPAPAEAELAEVQA
jgi:hypothetical protein